MNTRGVRPGDIVFVETPAERGYAMVETVIQNRRTVQIDYEPIGGDWQRGRLHRDPATARQVKGIWRKSRAA
jgi:hypothetical protein